MERKRPESMEILKFRDLSQALDVTVFSYKQFARIAINRNYDYLNLDNKHKKYRKPFIQFMEMLCDIIHASEPEVELNRLQWIQVCLDFFKALQKDYENRGLKSFFINQMQTLYAGNVFQVWCEENYLSVPRYLEIVVFSKKQKGNKSIKMKKVRASMRQTKIKGIVEITL